MADSNRSDQIIVRVTPEMHDQLRREAEDQERTVSQTVRLAVKQYLAGSGDQPPLPA